MDEDTGASYISLQDDEGNSFELEYIDTIEHGGKEYMVFLPADMDEDDPDYGLIILRVVTIDGEDQLEDVDDEHELQAVYEYYMSEIFDEEDDG